MKIRDSFTGHEHEVHLVWVDGSEYPVVSVPGITVPLNPLYFTVIEALPQEVAALSPAWRKVVTGALSGGKAAGTEARDQARQDPVTKFLKDDPTPSGGGTSIAHRRPLEPIAAQPDLEGIA